MSNANLYSIFASRFPLDKSAPCLILGDGRVWTYDDIERASGRMANLFASLGLKRGDRVAMQVEKTAEALVLYLATLRAGLAFLPLNPAYQRHELAYFLEDAQPGLFVCRPQVLGTALQIAKVAGVPYTLTLDEHGRGSLIDAAAPHADAFTTVFSQSDELATILYTSGTTGRSKGAMLSHRNLSSNALALSELWQFSSKDVLLHMLPIFHTHGLFVACNCVLLNGAAMLFEPRYEARRVLDLLPQATVFMGVPTHYTRLLSEADFTAATCKNIRLFVSGSAPLLRETFDVFKQSSGHTILERYGMTEGGMYTSNPYVGERRPGSVGQTVPGVSVRIMDEQGVECGVGVPGNIQVKGENLFSAYWRMPEKSAEEFTSDGYFRTGDIGARDADGYIFISGRARDLIISGGLNVYPKEVEDVIDAIPGVLESAVIGLPHADFGEAVNAVVVRQKNAEGERINEADIIAVVHAELAGFKVPKRVFIVHELPRNTMGKVQKNQLREKFA